jgi:hypothetical protein
MSLFMADWALCLLFHQRCGIGFTGPAEAKLPPADVSLSMILF